MSTLPAVVAPLREEIAPLLARLGNVERLATGGPGRFVRGRLGGRLVVAGFTGDGRRAARLGLEALLDRFEVSPLVVVGIAGGLVPELAVGDVVAARAVLDDDGAAPEPDSAWRERATALAGVRPGVVTTGRRILVTAAEKAALGGRVGEIATVDLETAVYARVAAAHGVPYAALRAVSDPAGEDLAVDFNRFCDADGHTRRRAVVGYALTHPAAIPALLGLGKRMDLCAARLAELVAELLDDSHDS